jgi:hypothetical protein
MRMLGVHMLSLMVTVTITSYYAEYHYAEYHYAEGQDTLFKGILII